MTKAPMSAETKAKIAASGARTRAAKAAQAATMSSNGATSGVEPTVSFVEAPVQVDDGTPAWAKTLIGKIDDLSERVGVVESKQPQAVHALPDDPMAKQERDVFQMPSMQVIKEAGEGGTSGQRDHISVTARGYRPPRPCPYAPGDKVHLNPESWREGSFKIRIEKTVNPLTQRMETLRIPTEERRLWGDLLRDHKLPLDLVGTVVQEHFYSDKVGMWKVRVYFPRITTGHMMSNGRAGGGDGFYESELLPAAASVARRSA